MKGTNFDNAAISVVGTYVLTGGSQIVVQGIVSLTKDATFSVVGGTGRYEGARGHVFSHNQADDSSTDTLTLLP